jgi:uncharacterized repeat protein (TIGR01451 family)
MLSFTATVNVSGSYTNTAQVTASDNFDPDSTPNNDDGDQSEDDEAALTPNITGLSDLSLSKSVALVTDADGRGSINAGDTVMITLTVSNAGPNDATGVSVVDVLPNGLLSIGNISNGGTEVSGTMTWSGLNVASGGDVVLTFTATVNASVSYINTAQITASNSFDPDSAPNNDDGDQSEDDEAALNLYPWHNGLLREDVDGINGVNARDALLIIGDLRMHGSYSLSVPRPASNDIYFPDVGPNNLVEAHDALLIIGYLRNPPASSISSENFQLAGGSNGGAAAEGERQWDESNVAVSLSPGGLTSANVAASVFLPLVDAAYADKRDRDIDISSLGANDRRQRDDLVIASSGIAKYDTLHPVADYQPRRADLVPKQLSNQYALTRDILRSLELESVLSEIAEDISEQWRRPS